MAKSFTFEGLKDDYKRLWAGVKLKTSMSPAIDQMARRIMLNKDRYVRVSEACGGKIPWDFIGVIHARESNLDFTKHLHNGDPLTKRTRHVPAGRPKVGTPPFSWEESAIDALVMKKLNEITDWSPERTLYELERFNGFGYRMSKARPLSPYLWSGTDWYTRGKFVADGRYSGKVVDSQLGTVPILIKLRQLEVPKAVLKEMSSTYSTLGRVKNSVIGFFGAIAASIAGLFSTENFNTAINWLTQLNGIVAPYWFVIALVSGALFWSLAHWSQKRQERQFREGRYIAVDPDRDATDAADAAEGQVNV